MQISSLSDINLNGHLRTNKLPRNNGKSSRDQISDSYQKTTNTSEINGLSVTHLKKIIDTLPEIRIWKIVEIKERIALSGNSWGDSQAVPSIFGSFIN